MDNIENRCPLSVGLIGTCWADISAKGGDDMTNIICKPTGEGKDKGSSI
ncbi:hypothetical protein [Desulfobulbus sp.]|nr:hypothetical protein [Desulfobulbus sp.]